MLRRSGKTVARLNNNLKDNTREGMKSVRRREKGCERKGRGTRRKSTIELSDKERQEYLKKNHRQKAGRPKLNIFDLVKVGSTFSANGTA